MVQNLIYRVSAILLLCTGWIQAVETDQRKPPRPSAEPRPANAGSRGYTLPLQKSAAAKGWSKYIRFSKHDGNLVEAGYLNQGQLSDGYTNGGYCGMNWPKGSKQRPYGYVFVYFVAGEVKDKFGNIIHIVSDRFNRGTGLEESPDQSHRYHFMPLPRYFNNHHKSSADWDMGGISEDVGVDGLPGTHDVGEGDGILQPAEDFNNSTMLDLSMVNEAEWSAMSNRRETWPADWPPQSYAGDPRVPGVDDFKLGPCAGRWNGEYGYYVRADQESYYIMDDHENDEFDYYPENLPGSNQPDTRPWPDGRRGLGVTVKVRNYQWNARLAEDILLSLYDVTNLGKRIDKSVIGMYCDVDVGENRAGNKSSFDTVDDITYVWDGLETWRTSHLAPTGYFGYAFLESPGLAADGKDNDEDTRIDESQYDKIDNDGDWKRWVDGNGNSTWDTEDLNYNNMLDTGEDLNGNGLLDYESMRDDVGSDGIGPDDDEYTGPDKNGSEANGRADWGEPNFDYTDNDESDQVGLTSWYLKAVNNRQANDEEFWSTEMRPGNFFVEAGFETDICFTYGCGYVPLETGKEGTQRYAIACLFGNDMADIFRNKRTMQTIYDNDYNFTKAPRKPVLVAVPGDRRVVLTWDARAEASKDPVYGSDFEGYKIYKSTDPSFTDIKTIRDAYNNPLLYQPLAQFDLKDGLLGPHPVTIGREGGPETDLGIGFDMGQDTGLRHFYVDTSVTNGRTYFYAVVSFDKGYYTDFYERKLSDRQNLQSVSPTECSVNIQADALGSVIFLDQNCAKVIPMEAAAGYVAPGLQEGLKHTSGTGTGKIDLKIITPYDVLNGHTYQLKFTDDNSLAGLNGPAENYLNGMTTGAWFIDVTDRDTMLTPSGDFSPNGLGDKIFDGFMLSITNDSTIEFESAKWVKGLTNLVVTMNSISGKAVPRDYEVRVMDVGADTSMGNLAVTNFQIWDVTESNHPFRVHYRTTINRTEPESLKTKLSAGDDLWIYVKPVLQANGQIIYQQRAWHLYVNLPSGAPVGTQQIVPQRGDILRLTTSKPFDRNDVFEFTMTGNRVEKQTVQNGLQDIYVVPNPYVSASSLEQKLLSEDMGRGDRRIDFVNLPTECTISIFTVAGRPVREIHHSAAIEKGRESWDLRTQDGLEIASGYYFYYIDAPGIGGKSGKFAVIK
jgi:hypothetical protein